MSNALHMLPYGRQAIDDDDVAAVVAVLKSDWLTGGPAVAAFEKAFADTVGAPHAIACSSGTAALHLAALALDLEPEDVVIVPAITFAATANAVRYVGAKVVFSDVDADTGLMAASHLEQALTRSPRGRVKAVIPVHLAGQPAAMAEIAELAQATGLTVIEDACHAIGSRYGEGGRACAVGACRHSRMAVFSTHPVKTIATGEGGLVTCRDEALAERIRRLRNHGIVREPGAFKNAEMAFADDGTPNPWYYEIAELGFNYRASDIHCALGLSQLAKLSRYVARRRALVARYDRLLERFAPHVRPLARRPETETGWHLYVVAIDFAKAGISRAALMRRLLAEGVGTQVHYIPVPLLPYYRGSVDPAVLPGAMAYYERALSLPLFPAMAEPDVDRVVSTLATSLGLANA